MFEKDRFFVDKVDTEKTAKGTLIQGSLASSTFVYNRDRRRLPMDDAVGNDARRSALLHRSPPADRLPPHQRRPVGGPDRRARPRASPPRPARPRTARRPHVPVRASTGQNEYELREPWLFRSGKRSDVSLGRQFIADLGAIKFDGLRIDYASAEATLLGFGGLYPVRGSR